MGQTDLPPSLEKTTFKKPDLIRVKAYRETAVSESVS